MKKLKKFSLGKLILPFALAFGLVPSVWSTEVATAEALSEAIAGNEDIVLANDINCTGWTPVEYSGTLDGKGHSITGLTGPLFLNLSGKVSNLTIDGAVGGVNTQIAIPDLADFGLLALTTTAARVESVNVKGYSLVNSQAAVKTNPKNNIGFLVACAFDGSQFVSDMTMEGCTVSLGGDLGFGGIVGGVFRSADFTGARTAEFSGCVNNVAITITSGCSAAGNGGVGGILGREQSGLDSKRLCGLVFTDCINNGSVVVKASSGNTAFGGIIGQAFASVSSGGGGNDIHFANCVNHGSFTAPSGANCNNMRLGGFIGMCGRYVCSISFDKCLNDGDVTINSSSCKGGTFGGFIGYAYDVSKNAKIYVLNSVTRGNILTTVRDGYVNQAGGFCALATLNANYGGVEIAIKNSAFSGMLTASSTASLFAQLGSGKDLGGVNAGMPFVVDNCWFLDETPLIDEFSKAGLESYSHYSVANVQYHVADGDEAENAALALVAAEKDDYVTWQVNSKSGHPEPVLGATLYTVIFNDWDGTLLSLQQVEEGMAAEAPDDPVRVGYKFTGWDPSDFSEVTDNMTIVATYEQSEDFRTVTFVDWDERELAKVTIEAGTAVGDKAPQPTRTGYTLVGWTLDGEPYDLNAAVTEDITLDAAYEINVYDVVFFDWEDNQLGETQKVVYLDSAVAPTLPELPEGKVFWKWTRDFSSVTENLDIHALICDQYQTISSSAEFAEKINADTPSVAQITLLDDIDLANWTSVDFHGSLDGAGYTIRGLTGPLFNKVTGTIRAVNLDGLVDDTPTEIKFPKGADSGVLANVVSGGTIEDCAISGFSISGGDVGNVIGLLAGRIENGAMIRRCATAGTISGATGVRSGGIAGMAVRSADYLVEGVALGIYDCTNTAVTVKSNGDNNTAGGCAGIVGRIETGNTALEGEFRVEILRCVNSGDLQASVPGARMGGIIGTALGDSAKLRLVVSNCVNFASVVNGDNLSDKYKMPVSAGIIGVVSGADSQAYLGVLDLIGCVNRGAVDVGFDTEDYINETDNGYNKYNRIAGGLVGLSALSKNSLMHIEDSANYGPVSGKWVGGLFGSHASNANYANSHIAITNCANYGVLTGGTMVGEEPLGGAGQVCARNVSAKTPTRTISNCFFMSDQLYIETAEGVEFTEENIIFPTTEAKDAVRSLNTYAAEHALGPWVQGKIDKEVYPELEAFCQRPFSSGLMLLIW